MVDEVKEEKTETVAEAPAEAAEATEEVVEEKKDEVKEEPKEEAKEEPKADQPAEAEPQAMPAGEKAPEVKVEPKKEVSKKFKEIVEKIESLSVLELSELVKELEERFGVSAAAPMMMAGAGVAAGAAAEEVEEKTSYDVIITSAGDKKIQVIKVVREVKPELGLKEAKDLVEAAPKELAKGMKKADAEEAKAKLEAAGASVELK